MIVGNLFEVVSVIGYVDCLHSLSMYTLVQGVRFGTSPTRCALEACEKSNYRERLVKGFGQSLVTDQDSTEL